MERAALHMGEQAASLLGIDGLLLHAHGRSPHGHDVDPTRATESAALLATFAAAVREEDD